MDRIFLFRIGIALAFMFSLLLAAAAFINFNEEISLLQISNVLPDTSGILQFTILFASAFVCGASAFSFFSGKSVMRNLEICSSFLMGVLIFGMLCFVSVYLSLYHYLPHISLALGLPCFFGRFIKLRFEPQIEASFLPLIILVILPLVTVPIMSWDSIYYHAEITRLIHHTGHYPDNFGSGIGMGISSNYPPLFSLFNAYLLSGSEFNGFLIGISDSLIILFALLSISSFKDLQNPLLRLLVAVWVLANLHPDTSYPLQFLFFSVALCFFREYQASRKPGDLFLSAIFLGGLCFTSYFGFVFAAFFTAFLLFSAKASFRATFTFIAICALVSGPWLLRTFELSGNPVYPFLNQVFNSEYLYDTAFAVTIAHLSVSGGHPIIHIVLTELRFPLLVLSLLSIFILGIKKVPKLHLCLLALGLSISLLPIFFPRYFLFSIYSALVIYSLGKEAAIREVQKQKMQGDLARILQGVEILAVVSISLYAFSSYLYTPCFLCTEEQISESVMDYGIPYYLNQHPEITSVVAFDFPTYYINLNTKVIPLDEGYVYEPILSMDDSVSRTCHLKKYSDYVILPQYPEDRGLVFIKNETFGQNYTDLELIQSFNTSFGSQGLYRITGCPP